MRVMMVGPSYILFMQRPMDWVLEAGHEVILVDYANRYGRGPAERLRFVPLQARGRRLLRRWLSAEQVERVVTELGAWQLRLLAAWLRPDVVHVHMVDGRADSCARAGIRPLVVSAWGSFNHLLAPGSRFVQDDLARRVLDATDVLLVESPQLAEACRAFAGRPLRVERLPMGTDTTRFRPGYEAERHAWRARLRIPPEAVVLLSPRGWHELYGHHHILEAFAQAFLHFRRPTVLLFVKQGLGKYSGSLRYLEQMEGAVAASGVAAHVRWLDALPYAEMPLLYALADAVVNYPNTDAFPSTLVEAAAAGKPVLTADLATYRGTFVEQFMTRVEPENPAALAEAMVSLVNGDPAERAPRLAAARQHIQAHYDERAIRERLLAIYESVRA